MEILNEQLQNRIVLLTKCVEFYSDDNNYKKNSEINKSPVELDGGVIAKHTLQILNKLKETDDELEELSKTLQNEIGVEETMKQIKELTEKYNNGR